MRHKEQYVMLLDPAVTPKINALYVVTGQSKAEILEYLVLNSTSLDQLMDAHAADVKRLDKLAKAAGQDRATYASAYAERWTRKKYRPTLADLEMLGKGKKAA